MYRSKKIRVCFFLALIIFLFSSYCIAMEADSFENLVWADNAVSTLNVEGTMISENEVIAEEILNTCGLSVGQSIIHQFRIAKKVVRLSWSFLAIQIFSYFILKIFVATYLMEIPKLHRNVAVLQYIHDIDGKK